MGFNAAIYALSKKYTDNTTDALGGVKGAPATIKSITEIDGGHRVTFEWTGTSGKKETSTLDVMDGQDGKDGKTPIKGVDYTDGKKGDKGEKGESGTNGITPNLQIGTVKTLNPEDKATATITGTSENPILNLGIPQGKQGEKGTGSGSGGGTQVDILEGKKILFVGDSICEGVGANGKPYPYWIQKLHPNSKVYNLGVGGMTISKKDSSVTNCIPDRIASGEFDNSDYSDPDIILFEGGINDMMRNVSLGYIKSTYSEPKNYENFCDALDYMFYYFKNKFPKTRMIFSSVHLIVNSISEYMQKTWWDCTSEMCSKWGIEYINMFKIVNAHFVEGLQLHPTADIHEKYYTPVLDNVLLGAIQSPVTTTNYYLKNRILNVMYYSGTKIFKINSEISASDWRINAVRTDNSTYANITSACVFDTSDVDNTKVGTYPIHVSFVDNGKSDSFDVNVDVINNGGKSLQEITATKTVTSSKVGVEVDNSDIVVTANYSDGSTSDVTSASEIDNTNVNTTKAGKYSILITYTENEKTVNTFIEYSVIEETVEKELSSITAIKTATSSKVGETIITSDIVVTANYSDGSSANVTSGATINTDEVNTSEANTYNINISYSENGITKSTIISYTVEAKQDESWSDETNITRAWDTTSATFATTNQRYEGGSKYTVSFNSICDHDATLIYKILGQSKTVTVKANESFDVVIENVSPAGTGSAQVVVYTTSGSEFPWNVKIKNFKCELI